MIKPALEALAINYEEAALTNHYVSECARNYDKTAQALKQCTLKRPVQITGNGPSRRGPVVMTLRPAPIYTGILFRRIDIEPIVNLKIDSRHIYTTSLQTSLVRENIGVYGIEHLMSALAGLGIDNIFIDINSAEIPIMDGSAEPFVFLMQAAGLKQQSALKRFIRVREKVQVLTNDAWVSVEPSETFQITCTLTSNKSSELSQQYSTTLSTSIYAKSLSRARHGTENTLSSNQRYANESIRHHVLDTIGDFYMLGYPTLGSFRSYNTNHSLNHRLIRKLLDNPTAWELIEYPLQINHQAESTY